MPILVNVDGTQTTLVDPPTDLASLQAMVGGLVQLVNLPGGELLLCNEEGKLFEMDVNDAATALWEAKLAPKKPYDFLVGPVVFFTAAEAAKLSDDDAVDETILPVPGNDTEGVTP